MEVRRLQPGDEAKLEAFLRTRVESSMFLLSNLRGGGIEDRGRRFQGTYVAAFEDGAVVSVAGLFWSGNIILQTPVHAAEVLSAIAARPARPIRGLIGPDEQVWAAAAILSIPETGERVQMNSGEGLYALDLRQLAVPADLATGAVHARRAKPPDLPLMTDWRYDYCVEALGSVGDRSLRQRCADDVGSLIRMGRLWLLESQGRPVAHTGFNAALPEAVQVGGVWTPPELRGRGYARAVVAASLLDARAEGVARGILFTGDDNPAAIRVYTALGFQRVGDYRLLLLRAG